MREFTEMAGWMCVYHDNKRGTHDPCQELLRVGLERQVRGVPQRDRSVSKPRKGARGLAEHRVRVIRPKQQYGLVCWGFKALQEGAETPSRVRNASTREAVGKVVPSKVLDSGIIGRQHGLRTEYSYDFKHA